MQHGAQDYILKSACDATSLTRALRLAIVRKRLQDVEQMLVAVVSHDLRAPLQTIILASDVMLAEPRPSKHAASVRRAAVRATALVNDLLDATRARLAGVLPIETASTDVAAITEQLVEEIRTAHPNRTIEVAIEGRRPIQVDGGRFSQVVQNLVGNALQHSPSSSAVRVRLAHRDQHIELSVHNTGAPIPEHLRAHLFEPLERPSRAQDPTHSVGLGLYIVSEIVRAHQGTINVDSTDQGTVFRVSLPISTE
jgi:signal transduction histidine kinase